MCLSKAMSLTRFKRKKAGGELRVQREMLKVFFTLARWAAVLKRTEECCVL